MRNKFHKITVLASAGMIATMSFLFCFSKHTIPVLTYHRFDYENSASSVTPENFGMQMKYLSARGFNVVTLDELVSGIKNKKTFPRNTIAITVDDGYKSSYTYAYPILKKHGFPATIFLITNRIDNNSEYLSWDDVREMSKGNIVFGSHTKNHICLPLIERVDAMREEIEASKKIIEEHLGVPVDYFCYPFGYSTGMAEILVKKAGYKGAFMSRHGVDPLNKDNVYKINRVFAADGDPYFSFSNIVFPIKFRVLISGYCSLLAAKG